jgi:hypothetical protein
MTSGFLASRRRKMELHRLSLMDPANFSALFKTYQNIFNTPLCASKKLTYGLRFALFAKNPKKK